MHNTPDLEVDGIQLEKTRSDSRSDKNKSMRHRLIQTGQLKMKKYILYYIKLILINQNESVGLSITLQAELYNNNLCMFVLCRHLVFNRKRMQRQGLILIEQKFVFGWIKKYNSCTVCKRKE